MKNKAVDAPIKFKKIVMVITKRAIAFADESRKQNLQNLEAFSSYLSHEFTEKFHSW